MHLLFRLSLIPFTTGWMGENQFAELAAALYGVSMLMPVGPSPGAIHRRAGQRHIT
jgi:uncharacterized membrane protein